MVSSKRADYVVRLLAKELIMLLACFLYFILKVLDSTIFALIKQINLHEPTRVVGMAKILSETFVLFIPYLLLLFKFCFSSESYLSNPLIWARNQPKATYKCTFNLSPSLQYHFLVFVSCIFRFVVFLSSTLPSLF